MTTQPSAIGSNKIKQGHNNYSISIFITALLGLGIGVWAIIGHTFSLGGLNSWLIDGIYGFYTCMLTSSLVSGNGYFYMFIDKLFNDKTIIDPFKKNPEPTSQENLNKRISNFQFFGILLGIVAAIGLTIVQFVFHVNLPFNSSTFTNILGNNVVVSIFSHAVLALGNFSMWCGIGNRSGRLFDYIHKNRQKNPESNTESFFSHKDIHYTLALIGGFLAGIVLISIIIFLLGTANFMSGGLLGTVIFSLTLLGSSASAAGYIGRVVDVLFDPWHWKNKLNLPVIAANLETVPLLDPTLVASAASSAASKEIKEVGTFKERLRRAESMGTILGIVIALAAGIILLTVAPPIIVVLFPVVTGLVHTGFIVPTVLAFCIASFGGLGNRLGHMIDKFKHKESNLGEQTSVTPQSKAPQLDVSQLDVSQPNSNRSLISPATNVSKSESKSSCFPSSLTSLFKKMGFF